MVGETGADATARFPIAAFSILKRIVVGETFSAQKHQSALLAFSILKRIVVGETYTPKGSCLTDEISFSILKRIVVGETAHLRWLHESDVGFQYPQTDRGG